MCMHIFEASSSLILSSFVSLHFFYICKAASYRMTTNMLLCFAFSIRFENTKGSERKWKWQQWIELLTKQVNSMEQYHQIVILTRSHTVITSSTSVFHSRYGSFAKRQHSAFSVNRTKVHWWAKIVAEIPAHSLCDWMVSFHNTKLIR